MIEAVVHKVPFRAIRCLALTMSAALISCGGTPSSSVPILTWYVFNEPSGAFQQAARDCSGRGYEIEVSPLPSDSDQQREQLVRRLAAGDTAIDVIGMDVIWTAEFASAGWIRPWADEDSDRVTAGRFPACVETARYQGRLWAIPFTTNAQLLWYRADRVSDVPATWGTLLDVAEALGPAGALQVQGARYEGLTVFFLSLLASAGGRVLDREGVHVVLEHGPLLAALSIMKRLGLSGASDKALSTNREDDARLAFETGLPSLMINYPFVWPSTLSDAPAIARHMAWARWPQVQPGHPSRVTVGGINLAVSAHSRYPELASRAAECLSSQPEQRRAALLGGLPPSLEALYDDPEVERAFPFAKVFRDTLRDAVVRPQTPIYSDISLGIARVLHPMRAIDLDAAPGKLRAVITRALRSEGLL